MNKKIIITALLTAVLALTSCHQSAQKTEAGQQADSSETVTNADALRLVVSEKAEIDSVVQAKLKMPLDSIIVEMVNNTNCTFLTGEAYTIEQRTNNEWMALPIKPRKDGATCAFNDIGYELAPHSSRQFTIHVEPDKYDFERGQEYRIVKEFFKKGKKVPQSVYCYFSFE